MSAILLTTFAQPAFCFERFLDQQLYSAVENGTGWLAKILLIVGADPNAKHKTEGTTPLMGAAGAGQTEMVKLLLDKGADPKLTDKNGASALNMGYHHIDIVKMLVEKGADTNTQPTMNGLKQLTPLMAATNDGDKEVVAYLLEHGADPTLKIASGKGAWELAEQRKFAEISKMISDAYTKKTGQAPGAPVDPNAVAGQPGAPGAPGAPAAPGQPGAPAAPAQAAGQPPAAAAPAPASATPPTTAPAAAAPPAAH